MNVVGIAAEYNPFHRGHAYQLVQTRRLLGEDALIVCVMSGDFVQRGEAAVFDKYARAEAACRCGVDLAVELPLPWSLSSAEGFAGGCVALLASLGCSHLSFGSESGDLNRLQAIEQILSDPGFDELVSARLRNSPNISYAAARELTAVCMFGAPLPELERPNDILALEYLKAIRRFAPQLQPLAIRRQGSEHDKSGGDVCSASELRNMLRQGNAIHEYVPSAAAEIFERESAQGRLNLSSPNFEAAILSRLRRMSREEFAMFGDAADGLDARLFRATRTEPTLEKLFFAAKTKRYALSRIRRCVYSAALGIPAGVTFQPPPYARILAMNSRGRQLLHFLSDPSIPILTKPASVRSLGNSAEQIFRLGSDAHDLYVLGFQKEESRRGGEDWRKGPCIL